MPKNPPYPRRARIVEVEKGDGSQRVIWYELRADYPGPNALISEHPSREEALDAQQRYQGSDKS